MKSVKLFVFMALIGGCCESMAGEFWSDDPVTNTSMIAANALLLLDWGQTRYSSSKGYKEVGLAKNFIGEYPTVNQVDRYFAASIIVTNAAGYFMPESANFFGIEFNPKKTFYIGVSVVQANTVENNYQLGVRADF